MKRVNAEKLIEYFCQPIEFHCSKIMHDCTRNAPLLVTLYSRFFVGQIIIYNIYVNVYLCDLYVGQIKYYIL